MAYCDRFRHSELHSLLARINRRVQEWIGAKYRRLRAYRAMKRARTGSPPRCRGCCPTGVGKPGSREPVLRGLAAVRVRRRLALPLRDGGGS